MIFERLLGEASSLPFPLLVSLRSQLLHRRAATGLTVLALASSVSLATAIEMTTRSLAEPLEVTTRSLMGSAQISVHAGEIGVDEALIEVIRAIPGVRTASPIISRTFRELGGANENAPVRVVAIDLLAQTGVRAFSVSRGGLTVRDPLALLASNNAIVLSKRLAQRLGTSEGGTLPLRSEAGAVRDFVIRGTLEGPLSDAFGGQVALMDVFGLQDLISFGRRVDRIDIAIDPDADVDAMIDRVAGQVGELITVERSQLHRVGIDSVLETLNFGLWSMAAIGIVLSLALSYAVSSLAVERRIEEIALLRVAGMEGRSVTAMILIDTALIAAFATVAGFVLAVLVADPLIETFSRISAFLQVVEIPSVSVETSTVAAAFAVGAVALVAAAAPAYRAGHLKPLELLHEHQAPPRAAGVNPRLAAMGLVAVAVFLVAWRLGPLPAGLRVLLVIVSTIVAVAAGVPQLLLRAQRMIVFILSEMFPKIGHLLGVSILERPVEVGATLTIWAAIAASLIAILSVVDGIVGSVDDAVNGIYRSAVFAHAQSYMAPREREPISLENIEIIRTTPGVLAVDENFVSTVMFRGEPVKLETMRTRAVFDHADAGSVLSDDPQQTIDALLRGELVMNWAFSRHFGIKVGDRVVLATPGGAGSFRVGGFSKAFGGPTGVLSLDSDEFQKWFEPLGALQVVFWTTEPRQDVVDEVARRVSTQALFLRHGENLPSLERLIGTYRDLLVVPCLLVGMIGVVSLASLLSGNVVSRARYLAILRAAGATRAHRVSLVVASGLILGGIGTACGLAIGIPWSQVLTDLIAEMLGYRVAFRLDLAGTGAIVLAAIGLSILSSLIAARPAMHPHTPGRLSLRD